MTHEIEHPETFKEKLVSWFTVRGAMGSLFAIFHLAATFSILTCTVIQCCDVSACACSREAFYYYLGVIIFKAASVLTTMIAWQCMLVPFYFGKPTEDDEPQPRDPAEAQGAPEKNFNMGWPAIHIVIAFANLAADLSGMVETTTQQKDSCIAKSTSYALKLTMIIANGFSILLTAAAIGISLWAVIEEILERRAKRLPTAQADIHLQTMDGAQQTEE